MLKLRFSAWWIFAMILLLTTLLGGCIINLDAGNASGGDTTSQGAGGGGGDAASIAEQARKDEVDRYVAQVIYKGATVNQSVQTAAGDMVDGLDRSKLPALPYPLPALPYLPSDVTLPPGVTFGISEVEKNAALADLVSKTAGYRRPDFSPYIRGETDATDIYDYVDRYQVGGAPKANRLYAGLISTTANRGVSGYMNQFQPEVADKSFSLLEFAVFCPAGGAPQEVVGAVISVDNVTPVGRNAQGVYDGLPRFHVEYATTTNGKTRYSWDDLDGTFVANQIRTVVPGQIVPVSVLGGATVEHLVTIFQVPTGDWWIAFDQNLIGYYPASKFTMLSGGACAFGLYGEVLNPSPPAAVKTEMGSGKHADAKHPNVASVRKPEFYDTSWFSMAAQGDSMQPNVASCYSFSGLYTDPKSGDSTFDLGGPGGTDPVCQWPQ